MQIHHVDIHASGMSCQHCVHSVTAAIVPLPGVTGVSVDLESGNIGVDSLEPIPLERLVSAIESAGYKVTPSA